FAPIVQPGLITKLYIKINSAGGATTYTNLIVKMGTTSQTTTTTTFIPGLAVHYTAATVAYPAHTPGDWFEITLQNPFLWNAVDNLVVEISQEGYTAGRTIVQWSSPDHRRTWGTSNPLNLTGSSGTGLAHLGIDMMPATPCTGQV